MNSIAAKFAFVRVAFLSVFRSRDSLEIFSVTSGFLCGLGGKDFEVDFVFLRVSASPW